MSEKFRFFQAISQRNRFFRQISEKIRFFRPFYWLFSLQLFLGKLFYFSSKVTTFEHTSCTWYNNILWPVHDRHDPPATRPRPPAQNLGGPRPPCNLPRNDAYGSDAFLDVFNVERMDSRTKNELFGRTNLTPMPSAGVNLVSITVLRSFIHSFKDLYSTSSRKLLRGAPDSSTVKKNSCQLIIECVWKCPR